MGKIKSMFLVSAFLFSCSFLEKKENPIQQLSKLIKLSDTMKNEIKDCKGEFSEVAPTFMSSGYFTYKVNDSFMEKLTKHEEFPIQNELNSKFRKTRVDYPFVENDLSFYTDNLKDKTLIKQFDIKNKVVFEGVYFPYKQQILYDTITKEAIHLISGIRD